MDYRFSVTVPAGTTEEEPAEVKAPLTWGVISGGFVRFPDGPAGLVHLAIYYMEQQIYPLNRGEDYIGAGTNIPLGGSVDISEPPYIVKLRGWAPNATLEHTVYVEFTVERPAAVPIAVLAQDVELPEGF